jgi:hypothetical protein
VSSFHQHLQPVSNNTLQGYHFRFSPTTSTTKTFGKPKGLKIERFCRDSPESISPTDLVTYTDGPVTVSQRSHLGTTTSPVGA